MNPQVTYPNRLYSVKIMKIRALENFTFGHLSTAKHFCSCLPRSCSHKYFNLQEVRRGH